MLVNLFINGNLFGCWRWLLLMVLIDLFIEGNIIFYFVCYKEFKIVIFL